MMAKMDRKAAKMKADVKSKPVSTTINADASEEGSDITAKPVSDITNTGNQVSLRQINN